MADVKSEEQRLYALYDMQRELHEEGYRLVAGVDEAGRGPIAGPVVAAAVVLEVDTVIEGLKDSKLLSEKKREAIYDAITAKALAWAYDVVDRDYIDENNILRATELAMTLAVNKLNPKKSSDARFIV
jgi:ribonuclease HII